ncbi:MAG: hypothetical protein Udaeo2_32350 [Candidatus Udaeobacter sp.]|nr:MAG: hypothetical protein Udaeo2_32350 [Candidatus Udaeobacter sp.]
MGLDWMFLRSPRLPPTPTDGHDRLAICRGAGCASGSWRSYGETTISSSRGGKPSSSEGTEGNKRIAPSRKRTLACNNPRLRRSPNSNRLTVNRRTVQDSHHNLESRMVPKRLCSRCDTGSTSATGRGGGRCSQATVVFHGRRNFERKTAQADAKETASKRAAFVS